MLISDNDSKANHSPYTYNIVLSGDLYHQTKGGDFKVLIELKQKQSDNDPLDNSGTNNKPITKGHIILSENNAEPNQDAAYNITNDSTHIKTENPGKIGLNLANQQNETNAHDIKIDPLSTKTSSLSNELVLKGGGPNNIENHLYNSNSLRAASTINSNRSRLQQKYTDPTPSAFRAVSPQFFLKPKSLFPEAEESSDGHNSEGSISAQNMSNRSVKRMGSFDSGRDSTIKSIRENFTRNAILNSGLFEPLSNIQNFPAEPIDIHKETEKINNLKGGGIEIYRPSSAPSSSVNQSTTSSQLKHSDFTPYNLFSDRISGYMNQYFDKEWLESYMRELNRRYRFIGQESTELEDALFKTYKTNNFSRSSSSSSCTSSPKSSLKHSTRSTVQSKLPDKPSHTPLSQRNGTRHRAEQESKPESQIDSFNVVRAMGASEPYQPASIKKKLTEFDNFLDSNTQRNASLKPHKKYDVNIYNTDFPSKDLENYDWNAAPEAIPRPIDVHNAFRILPSSPQSVNIPPMESFTRYVHSPLWGGHASSPKSPNRPTRPNQRNNSRVSSSYSATQSENKANNNYNTHMTSEGIHHSIYGGASNPPQSTDDSSNSATSNSYRASKSVASSPKPLSTVSSDTSLGVSSHRLQKINDNGRPLLYSPRVASVASITPSRLSMASLIPQELLDKSRHPKNSERNSNTMPKKEFPLFNSDILNVLERTGGVPNISFSSGVKTETSSHSLSNPVSSSFSELNIRNKSFTSKSIDSSINKHSILNNNSDPSLGSPSLSGEAARYSQNAGSSLIDIRTTKSETNSNSDQYNYAHSSPSSSNSTNSLVAGNTRGVPRQHETREYPPSDTSRPNIVRSGNSKGEGLLSLTSQRSQPSSASMIPKAPTPLFGRFPTPPPQAYIQSTGSIPSQSESSIENRSSKHESNIADSSSTLMDALKKEMMNLPKVDEDDKCIANDTQYFSRNYIPVNGSESILVSDIRGGGDVRVSYPNKPSSIAPSESVSCVPFRSKEAGVQNSSSNHLRTLNSSQRGGSCLVCGKKTQDVNSQPGSHIHISCLRCETCGQQLNKNSYRFIDGHVFCEFHFDQYFPSIPDGNGLKSQQSPKKQTSQEYSRVSRNRGKNSGIEISKAQQKSGSESVGDKNHFPFPAFKFGQQSFQNMAGMSFANFDDFIQFMSSKKDKIESNDSPLMHYELSGNADKKKVKKVEQERSVTPQGSEWLTERQISKELQTKVFEKKTLLNSSSNGTPAPINSTILGGSGGPRVTYESLEIIPGRDSKPNKSSVDSVASSSGLCPTCNKDIYITEKISFESMLYHKHCLKCVECLRSIRPDNAVKINGNIYCYYHANPLMRRSSQVLTRKKSKSVSNIRELATVNEDVMSKSNFDYKNYHRNNHGVRDKFVHKPLPAVPDSKKAPSAAQKNNYDNSNFRRVPHQDHFQSRNPTSQSNYRHSIGQPNSSNRHSYSNDPIMTRYLDPRGPSIADNLYLVSESERNLLDSKNAMGASGAVSVSSHFNPFADEQLQNPTVEKHHRQPQATPKPHHKNRNFPPQVYRNNNKPVVSSPLAVYKSTISNDSTGSSLITGIGNTQQHIDAINRNHPKNQENNRNYY